MPEGMADYSPIPKRTPLPPQYDRPDSSGGMMKHFPLLKSIDPPFFLFLSLLLMLILKWIIPAANLIFPPWNLLGLLPLGLGITINILADRKFHVRQTTVKPNEIPSCLITDGVFRYSRNPMYLGMVLILLGFTILLDSWISFLVLPGFTIFVHYRFICHEEKNLKEQFSEDWLAYQQKIPRWI